MMGYIGYGSNIMLSPWTWILLIGIVLIIFSDVKTYLQPPRQFIPVDNRSLTEKILDQRYTRGEISIEEYEYKRALLKR